MDSPEPAPSLTEAHVSWQPPAVKPWQPPSALLIELPAGDSIDCYQLAQRIAEALETPCCKVDTLGPTRRATHSQGIPDLQARLAIYRGHPYSPTWDPDMQLRSPLQARRDDEALRRLGDIARRVKQGRLTVFTAAHVPTDIVGHGAYMTRSSAEQYLKACGFQVLGVDEPTRADSPDLPISTQNAATPLTNDDHAQATSRSAVQQEAREQPSVEKQRKKAPISTTPSDTPSPHSCAAAPQAQTGNTGAKVLRIHEAMARTGLGRTSF